jgi:hypothetical protein
MEENEDPRDKYPVSATLAKKACPVPYTGMSFRFCLGCTELGFQVAQVVPASWASAWS